LIQAVVRDWSNWGIERFLRARVGEIVAVVDVSGHEAGRSPFWTPEKR
jgi:hypothetical protein